MASTRVDARQVLVVLDDVIDESRIDTAKTRESLRRFADLLGLPTSTVSFAGRDILLDVEAGWPRGLRADELLTVQGFPRHGRTYVSRLLESFPCAGAAGPTRQALTSERESRNSRLLTIAILAALARPR